MALFWDKGWTKAQEDSQIGLQNQGMKNIQVNVRVREKYGRKCQMMLTDCLEVAFARDYGEGVVLDYHERTYTEIDISSTLWHEL
jgi:hypothetical protein